MTSKWSEIRTSFLPEIVYVDAWLTDDDAEEGKVIAYISSLLEGGQPQVRYLDECAKTDPYAQNVIGDVLETLRNNEGL